MADHEHEWVALSATINDDGSYLITYKCERCPATKTEGAG